MFEDSGAGAGKKNMQKSPEKVWRERKKVYLCNPVRERFPDGHEKIIDKTGETVQQVPKNKEFESVNSVSGVAEMSAGHAGMKRMPGSEKLKHYTKKSLILAQDER